MDSKGRKREENTMPVELAIQRELVYRRKIAASNSTKQTLPVQAKPSTQASHQMPLSGPSSKQFSGPNLSGTKRKEVSTSSVHQYPHQRPRQFHGSLINHKASVDNLSCKICQVLFTSPFNLKQHLIGQKHKENLQEKGKREGGSHQRQWCEICKVSCMNEDLLKLHFQGQKHKAKLQDLKIDKQDGEVPDKPHKWCGVCKLWCVNEFSFNQHLQGKKHIIQLHALEKEKEIDGN